MTTSDPRVELERLQEELSTRQSITSFAHAAVALLVAMIIAGAAGKLFWDSVKIPYLGIAAAITALGLVVFALARYARGRRQLRVELERFERMQGLRRSLGIDDPTAFLPGR